VIRPRFLIIGYFLVVLFTGEGETVLKSLKAKFEICLMIQLVPRSKHCPSGLLLVGK